MILGYGYDATQVDLHEAAQANNDSKVDQARAVLADARRELGLNLCGCSIVDLLADNFPWSLEQCRQIAQELRS